MSADADLKFLSGDAGHGMQLNEPSQKSFTAKRITKEIGIK